MLEENTLGEMKMDMDNLWKEEVFTDLKVGTIRKLAPIKKDGTPDDSRTPVFSATTNIMTPSGSIPLSGEIEATTLEEAVEQFPEAINKAVQTLKEDMLRLQQEQASKIVTPDELRGGNDLII